jgi:hypothetical protein
MGGQNVLALGIEVNSFLGLLNRVVLRDVTDILEVHAVSIYRVADCATETSAISPTIAWYKNLITEFMSIINESENLSIYLSCLWLYSPLLGLGRFFSSFNVYIVGRTPWTGDQPVARPLPTDRTTQTQNKRTQTSLPREGFEPMILVFKLAKTVYALDRAATVVGKGEPMIRNLLVMSIDMKFCFDIGDHVDTESFYWFRDFLVAQAPTTENTLKY